MVWLGKREPELYGTITAEELDSLMRERADSLGIQLDIFYANIEGEAIARIYQGAKDGIDGLLMNPAGFTYAGFALRDCIKARTALCGGAYDEYRAPGHAVRSG